MAEDDEPDDDFQEEVSKDEIALVPGDAGDPQAIVEKKVPADIRKLYEVYSYRGAAVLLAESYPAEFAELLDALRAFKITTEMIRKAGGNESEIPKLLSALLRPHGWNETVVRGDLLVKLTWKEKAPKKGKFEIKSREVKRANFLDGHKIDYVKGKVAFDLEWNSKDQTFDRDLYAFNAFALCGAIDVGVLVTRSASLNSVFRKLGQALTKDGKPAFKSTGEPRMTMENMARVLLGWGSCSIGSTRDAMAAAPYWSLALRQAASRTGKIKPSRTCHELALRNKFRGHVINSFT